MGKPPNQANRTSIRNRKGAKERGSDSLAEVAPSLNNMSQVMPDDNSVPENMTPSRQGNDSLNKTYKTVGGRALS